MCPRTMRSIFFASSSFKIWSTFVLTCVFVGALELDRLDTTLTEVFDHWGYQDYYLQMKRRVPACAVLHKWSHGQKALVDIFQIHHVLGQKESVHDEANDTASNTHGTEEETSNDEVQWPWSQAKHDFATIDFNFGSALAWTLLPCAMQAFSFVHLCSEQGAGQNSAFQNVVVHSPAPGHLNCPVKVLLVGDSLMMEGFGPVLLRTLRQREDFEVRREAKYSTGLSRPDYFDWQERMAELVLEFDPDLVLICLGANDAQDIIDEHKKRHIAGSKSWAEQYFARALNLSETAQGQGAKLIWVGLPIMGKEPHASRVKMLSQEQLAATLVAPETRVYVNTYAVLADEQGQFSSLLPDENGIPVRIRHKDKIHVNEAGGKMLVDSVLPFVELFYPKPQMSHLDQARAIHYEKNHVQVQ